MTQETDRIYGRSTGVNVREGKGRETAAVMAMGGCSSKNRRERERERGGQHSTRWRWGGSRHKERRECKRLKGEGEKGREKGRKKERKKEDDDEAEGLRVDWAGTEEGKSPVERWWI